MSVETLSDGSGASAVISEPDKYTEEDIHKSEPQDAHAVSSGHAAESDDGGCADKSGSVAHGHDKGVDRASCEEIIFGVSGFLIAEIA